MMHIAVRVMDPADVVGGVGVPWQLYVAAFLAMFVFLWPVWHALEPGQQWEGGHRPGPGRHRAENSWQRISQ